MIKVNQATYALIKKHPKRICSMLSAIIATIVTTVSLITTLDPNNVTKVTLPPGVVLVSSASGDLFNGKRLELISNDCESLSCVFAAASELETATLENGFDVPVTTTVNARFTNVSAAAVNSLMMSASSSLLL